MLQSYQFVMKPRTDSTESAGQKVQGVSNSIKRSIGALSDDDPRIPNVPLSIRLRPKMPKSD
jgi:hypothetical protein